MGQELDHGRVGMACLCPSWELETSAHFFTHVSGYWAGMTAKLSSAVIVNQRMFVWPFRVVGFLAAWQLGSKRNSLRCVFQESWVGQMKKWQIQVQLEEHIDSTSWREKCQRIGGHFPKTTTHIVYKLEMPATYLTTTLLLESECTLATHWSRSWNTSSTPISDTNSLICEFSGGRLGWHGGMDLLRGILGK